MSCNGPGDCTCQPLLPTVDIEVFCWHQLVGWTPYDTSAPIGSHLAYGCSYGGLYDRYLRKVRTKRYHGTLEGTPFDVAQTNTYWQDHWTGQAQESQEGFWPQPPGFPNWVLDSSKSGVNASRWWVIQAYHHRFNPDEQLIEEEEETLSELYPASQFLNECSALYGAFSLEQLVDFAGGVQEQGPLGVKWLYLSYDANGNPQLTANGDKVILEQSPYEDYWYDALYLFGAGTDPVEYPWVPFRGLQSIRVVGQAPAFGKARLTPAALMRNVVEPLIAPCGPWMASACASVLLPQGGYVQVFRESPGKEIILPGAC